MKEYSSLLQRQIKKCKLDISNDPNLKMLKLLDLVNEAYLDFEEQKMLLERSLEISSKEFQESIEATHKLEAQLIQNEKMAGIGQLSSGIAHEINNPLGYVQSNVETLNKYLIKIKNMHEMYSSITNHLEQLDYDDFKNKIENMQELNQKNKMDFIFKDLTEMVSATSSGLSRISKIVNSLLGFARRGMQERLEEYDLNDGIKNTMVIANNEIKYCADVIENFEDIPGIIANAGEINQVILNLLINAAHAIKSKGEKGTIALHTYCDEDYVYFEIKDNGIGMSEGTMKKIFEPFFTTKPVGSGTGLGLSIAYDIIVNRHHGQIIVDSKAGEGSVFRLQLPVLQEWGEG